MAVSSFKLALAATAAILVMGLDTYADNWSTCCVAPRFETRPSFLSFAAGVFTGYVPSTTTAVVAALLSPAQTQGVNGAWVSNAYNALASDTVGKEWYDAETIPRAASSSRRPT